MNTHNHIPQNLQPRFLLVVVVAALLVAQADALGYYTDGWERVLSNATGLADAALMTSSRSTVLAELVQGQKSFLLDLHPVGADEASPELYSIPFVAIGLCVAYNIPTLGSSTLSLTVEELVRGLRGVSTVVTVNGVAVDLATLTIGLDSGASVLKDIQNAAVASGVSAVLTDDLIAVVKANGRARFFTTEQAAIDAVVSNANSIGFTWKIAAVSANAQCADVQVPHPLTNVMVSLQPATGASGTVLSVNRTAVPVVLSSRASTEAAYPLVAMGTLIVSRSYAATRDNEEWTKALRAMLGASAGLANIGLTVMPPRDTSAILTEALEYLPNTIEVVDGRGSGSVAAVVNTWAINYFVDNPIFVAYNGLSSGKGLQAIKDDADMIAAAEARFSDAEYAAFPTVQFIPATSFPVSVTFNLPGERVLSLPRCTVVDIFTGAVKFWDDAAIARFNPTTRLPHQPITVYAEEFRAGTTSVFTTGLVLMDQICQKGGPARLNATGVFTENVFAGFTNLVTKATTTELVVAVRDTPYAIGYAAAGYIRTVGGLEAVLVDEDTGKVSGPTVDAVQGAFERAVVDPSRLTVDFEPDSSAYPFVGVTYWVLRRSRAGNFTELRHALRFMQWAYDGAAAATVQVSLNFVPLPAAIVTRAKAALDTVTADGRLVVGSASAGESSSGLSGGAIAGIVIGCVAFLILVAAALNRGGPDNACAPRNPSSVTMMFTDIESSTALWGEAPDIMNDVLDAHNAIIRAAIKRHKCYEVKVIGDAFMISCDSPVKAVELALDIQESLYDHAWPEDISELYLEFHEARGSAVMRPEAAAKWWSGVRVRIGIATGAVDIKQDETSKRYDYFGSTVNLAARIEAAGHGGQILVDDATATGAASVLSSATVAVQELGPVELRGFSEGHLLSQVLPTRLSGRTFQPLRTEAKSPEAARNSVFNDYSTDGGDTTTDGGSSLTSDPRTLASSSHGDLDHRDSTTKPSDSVYTLEVNPLDFIEVLLGPFKQKEREALIHKLARKWRIEGERPHRLIKDVCFAAGKASMMRTARGFNRKGDGSSVRSSGTNASRQSGSRTSKQPEAEEDGKSV